MSKLKILFATRQNSAVGYYRHWIPARISKQLGHEVEVIEGKSVKDWAKPNFAEWAIARQGQYDIVFSDRVESFEDLVAARTLATGGRLVIDHDDDYRSVPRWNPAFSSYRPEQEKRKLADLTLKISELVTFSTENLAKALGDDCRAWRVYHNHLDLKDWQGLPVCPDRGRDPRIRILYGGAAGHYGDMDEVRDALEAFLRGYSEKVRLIVMGTAPAWVHELHRKMPALSLTLSWVPFSDYAKAVAWGGFDMAIVPLAGCQFNSCKSLIKAMEAGAQGIPAVVSKVEPYNDLPASAFLRVPNTFEDWMEALELLATDRGLRDTLRKESGEWVQGYTLERGVKEWKQVLEAIMEQERILDPSQLS